jgi:hypothetical protein
MAKKILASTHWREGTSTIVLFVNEKPDELYGQVVTIICPEKEKDERPQ